MPTNPLTDHIMNAAIPMLRARLRMLKAARHGATEYMLRGSPEVKPTHIAHFDGQIEELELALHLLRGEL